MIEEIDLTKTLAIARKNSNSVGRTKSEVECSMGLTFFKDHPSTLIHSQTFVSLPPMAITQQIQELVESTVKTLYPELKGGSFQINQTKPEFEGDYTVVTFGLSKPLKKSPEAVGKELGEQLLSASN